MSFIGTFHPLLVHFPIALVLAAAAAELVVIATPGRAWRTVAVANIRAGAAVGIVTALLVANHRSSRWDARLGSRVPSTVVRSVGLEEESL
jgi:predicted membrane protein DUF2231